MTEFNGPISPGQVWQFADSGMKLFIHKNFPNGHLIFATDEDGVVHQKLKNLVPMIDDQRLNLILDV